MTLYGTPQTVALNQRLEEDHIPTTSPGFGISAAPLANTWAKLRGPSHPETVSSSFSLHLSRSKMGWIRYLRLRLQDTSARERVF